MMQLKKWSVSVILVLLSSLMFNLNAFACGPTPQKVVKEMVIKADPSKVWLVLNQFDAIAQWHPDVKSSVALQKVDDNGDTASYRVITLKNGFSLEEKRRILVDDEMKLDYQMTQGDFLVSNYRGVMQVKPGAVAGETIVSWTGRFNNKANILAAPEGQDNAAAINAITVFYEDGLAGLKTFVETTKP